ncbi:unnamed protein product [Closterium sp. NIES-54]
MTLCPFIRGSCLAARSIDVPALRISARRHLSVSLSRLQQTPEIFLSFQSDPSAAALSIRSPKALNKKRLRSDCLGVPHHSPVFPLTLSRHHWHAHCSEDQGSRPSSHSSLSPGSPCSFPCVFSFPPSPGTTGTLIAQKIKEVGLPATLAGRNLQKLQSIGKAVDLPVAAVDLNDTQGLVELVGKHKVVLHVAGGRDAQGLVELVGKHKVVLHVAGGRDAQGLVELVGKHKVMLHVAGVSGALAGASDEFCWDRCRELLLNRLKGSDVQRLVELVGKHTVVLHSTWLGPARAAHPAAAHPPPAAHPSVVHPPAVHPLVAHPLAATSFPAFFFLAAS